MDFILLNEFVKCFYSDSVILIEGSVGLRMTNEFGLSYDKNIMHASYIYDKDSRKALEIIYGQYLQVAQEFELPIMIMTNTRRVNKERVLNSSFRNKNIINDYVDFLNRFKTKYRCEI